MDLPSVETSQRSIRGDPDAGPAASDEPSHGAADDPRVPRRRVAPAPGPAPAAENVRRRYAGGHGIRLRWNFADRN